jgi:WD40 repeat protein
MRRIARQLLGWPGLAVALFALGCLLYLVAPPAPRWRLSGERLLDFTLAGPISIMPAGAPLLTCEGQDSDTGPLRLRDPATGELCATLIADRKRFDPCARSSDGRRFAFTVDQAIHVIGLQSRDEVVLPTRIGRPHELLFSPDGATLAIRTRDHKVFLADVRSGETMHEAIVPSPLAFFDNDVVSWAFTPDSAYFVYPSPQKDNHYVLRAWDIASRRVAFDLDGTERIRLISPDSTLLLGATFRKERVDWVVWDLRERRRYPLEVPMAQGELGCRFSRSGRVLGVWKGWLGPCGCPLDFREFPGNRQLSRIDEHLAELYAPLLSPDGRYFIAYEQDWKTPTTLRSTVVAFDTTTGKVLWRRPHPFIQNEGGYPWMSDSGTIFVLDPTCTGLDLVDPATGDVRCHVPLGARPQEYLGVYAAIAPDEKLGLLCLERETPNLHPVFEFLARWLPGSLHPRERGDHVYRILDLEANRVTGGVTLSTRNGSVRYAVLPGDGNGLITAERVFAPLTPHIECWDLTPRVAWQWVLGPPLVLGAMAVLGCAGLRKRARKAAT